MVLQQFSLCCRRTRTGRRRLASAAAGTGTPPTGTGAAAATGGTRTATATASVVAPAGTGIAAGGTDFGYLCEVNSGLQLASRAHKQSSLSVSQRWQLLRSRFCDRYGGKKLILMEFNATSCCLLLQSRMLQSGNHIRPHFKQARSLLRYMFNIHTVHRSKPKTLTTSLRHDKSVIGSGQQRTKGTKQ